MDAAVMQLEQHVSANTLKPTLLAAPTKASWHKGRTVPFLDGNCGGEEMLGVEHGWVQEAAIQPHPKPIWEAMQPQFSANQLRTQLAYLTSAEAGQHDGGAIAGRGRKWAGEGDSERKVGRGGWDVGGLVGIPVWDRSRPWIWP